MSQPNPTPTPASTTPPNETPFRYTALLADTLERAWQDKWDSSGTFEQPNPGDAGFDASRPKFYCLDMFPYPSGSGLHVGHPEGYTATDIICRYKRMKGFNVLHPMGWDAFGLPAEQYAIQTGIHPAITTRTAIDNFRRQLKRFGFSYDWSREFGTIDPGYYKWTQWIFVKLYDAWFDGTVKRARAISELVEREKALGAGRPGGAWSSLTDAQRRTYIDARRLAYIGEQTVNWCPKLGTVLANDEVIDGRSERGNYPVLRKPLRQWMFRITAYADRLLDQLHGLDWPSSTKAMQSEWIGRSEGAEIDFALGTPTPRVGSPALGTTTPRVGSPALGTTTPRVVSLPEPSKATSPQFIPSSTLDNLATDTPLLLDPEGFLPRDPYPEGSYGPARDLIMRHRNLPHFEMPGATYFVSWRVLPGETLSESERTIALDALLHFDGKRGRVYAACVMPDHVHWAIRPDEGHSLQTLCESVKHFSATQINKSRGSSGRLWDPEAFDHIIRDRASFSETLAYIASNPVEAGLVNKASEYRWTFVHAAALGKGTHAERGGTQALRVFTTRPDTLFGATYMVIAPEHPLVQELLARSTDPSIASAVRAYVAKAKNLSDIERMENKKKTGVFSGLTAVNPANGQSIPVWIADYVLMGYGTGAIMAVPAHDERDYEFAKAHDLPIRDVVYDRTRLAMAYFAQHAPQEARTPERWMGVLADLLGYITSKSTPTTEFAAALDFVFTHRDPAAQGTAMTIHQTAPQDRPGGIGERRGATQVAWLDALVEMGFKSVDDFIEQFTTGRVFETSGEAFTAPGQAVNSTNAEVSLDGLGTDAAKARMTQWLTTKGLGATRVNYKFRDWTFSRQRYWGEPFPIVYTADGTPYPISPSALPVTLPELADYAPIESDDPLPLLAKATSWVNTTAGEAGVDPSLLPPGTPVRRETNTMPGSAGSSWYAVRYCDPKNDAAMVSREADTYWMSGSGSDASTGCVGGVDLYLGGSEHAVGHLLYSRFWHNVLHDLGYLSTAEPFHKLFHQGLITSFSYQRPDKSLVPTDMVEEVAEGQFIERATGVKLTPVTAKMSKSLKNVVNPDDVIAEFGADTFRLYEMYMGPLEASKPWNPRDITGLFRFLSRVWRLAIDEKSGTLRLAPAGESHHTQTEKLLHRMIAKVAGDIERLSFNTAIATMIEFVNAVPAGGAIAKDQLERFLLVLAPFAPHLAEELWAKLGHTSCISLAPWPAFDPAMLKDDSVELAVQIQGKVKCKVMVPSDADAKAIEALTLADSEVQKHLAGKSIKKIVVVPGRLVNIVAV